MTAGTGGLTAQRACDPVERIVNGRLLGRTDLVDIVVVDGRIDEIVPSGARGESDEGGLDVGGRLVLPGFVDAHVHLDKAFVDVGDGLDGPADLEEAIELIAARRATGSLASVRRDAERALDLLVGHGVVAARVHVEVDPTVGLDLVTMHQSLAAETSACALQLVGFPQRGLSTEAARSLLAAAMKEGLDAVGGCPYADDDPAAHLDAVFALAERHDVPIDLHLDLGDDPDASLIDLVVERTLAHGIPGRVVVGHMTTLAAMDPGRRHAALDAMATAGIALVVLPVTDLHLAGRGRPATRSVAPVAEAAAAGVTVAVANNNVANPFAPFGNGNVLQAAWLAGICERATESTHSRILLDAITDNPRRILGLPPHRVEPGADADLVVVERPATGLDVISLAPAVHATVRAGRLRRPGADDLPGATP